jgi:hypothetical protein
MPDSETAIVLTGALIPSAPFTTHADPQTRRREYLEAIRFYRRFAPVYFLENSAYRLGDDAEFAGQRGLRLRQMPVSSAPERGKGYQEFEMIEAWLAREQPPPRWIKITGRYLYRNFAALFDECRRERRARMIVDLCARSQFARSHLFWVETDFYRAHLVGVYRECDDEAGEWIEPVLYRRLIKLPRDDVRVFSSEPRLTGISGSTGGSLETNPLKHAVKRVLRKINYALDRRQLWYTR